MQSFAHNSCLFVAIFKEIWHFLHLSIHYGAWKKQNVSNACTVYAYTTVFNVDTGKNMTNQST
jgi:hypothetical protein